MNSMDVNLTIIKQKASIGVTQLVHRLLD